MYTQYSSTEVLHLFSLSFWVYVFSGIFCSSQPERKVTSSDAIYIALLIHLTVKCLYSKETEDLQPLVPFTFDVFKK